MKEKIVFFGAGPYILSVVETLSRELDLALVITTETDSNTPILSFCKSNNIEYFSASSLSSEIINNKLSIMNVRSAVLASFGLIIPDEILKLFEFGIINIHPSLLPKYRGPTPIQTAILNGDSTTGVSIIKLDSEVDHGLILAQTEEKIEPNDTSESLYKRLFKIGGELLVEILPKYISGELKPIEQNHAKATFTNHLTRQSGFIDMSSKELETGNGKLEIARRIRAFYPWPGVWFNAELNGAEKIIKLFPENRIQVEGKNVMSLKDFANGYPEGQEILQKLSLNE